MQNNNFRNVIKLISVFFADGIIFGILAYVIFQFFDVLQPMSSLNITILSVVTILLLLYVFFRSGNRYGLSAALLAYLILTQFGMSTIYYLVGPEALTSYSSTTLRFLNSSMYNNAIILGLISIIFFVYGSKIGSKMKDKRIKKPRLQNTEMSKLVYYSGMLFLLITLSYLLFFMLIGRVRLGMSYHSYLNSGIVNGLYSWVLFIYSSGICFIVSVAKKSSLRNGLILFGLSAIIFFSTGNRGEVLYATLAAMGILFYRNDKLKFKYIFLAIGLVFIIIPFIRATRNTGATSTFDLFTVNSLDAFAEMGHQLRLSVLILEDFAFGAREYLLGFSYYNPFINIIDNLVPGSIQLSSPKDFNFDTAFSGLGFSQVAESYANFGMFGVGVYHFLIAFLLRKAEVTELKGIRLAYWGTVLSILINATRNRFAFVIGQLFILMIIILIIEIFSSGKNVSRKGR